MNKQTWSYYSLVVVVWLVIGLGMFIRIHNGDYFPIFQNDDGLFYVWVGNSIYQDFLHPSSLTIFEIDNPEIFWRSQYRDLIPVERFGFRLSEKWFDHPFLATLLIALPARYFGFSGFTQIPQLIVRTPAFGAALLTLILTYVLTSQLYNRKLGLLALILLVFWPLAVFSQRQSYLENFVTPLFLLGLIILWQSRNKKVWKYFIGLSLCGIMAAWTKFAGYALFGIFAYFLKQFNHDRWSKLILWVGTITLLGYALYGQLVGGKYFWWTIIQQGERGAYLTSIFKLTTAPQVQGGIQDGWWLIGLFGLIYMATKKQLKEQVIGFSGIAWLLMAFFLSGPLNTSPWYIYPIYPLMMIGAAVMISRGIKLLPITIEAIIIMLGFSGYELGGIEVNSLWIRIGIIFWVGINLIWLYYYKSKSNWFHTIIVGALLCLAMYGNLMAIREIPNRICENSSCVKPTKIILPI